MDKSKNGNGGLIVNISSVAGLEPSGMFAVYSAAKCGLTAFTRAMAVSNERQRANQGYSEIRISKFVASWVLSIVKKRLI